MQDTVKAEIPGFWLKLDYSLKQSLMFLADSAIKLSLDTINIGAATLVSARLRTSHVQEDF